MSYFFYGSPRIAQSGRLEQYGLFNFVIGRFVLVHPDQQILNTVKKLFSSRYQLILCSIHSAKNFNPELIDNTVCYNWSTHSQSTMRATRFPEFDILPIECDELLECEAIDTQEQIWLDKEYFWCACTYIDLLTKDISRIGSHYHKFLDEELPMYASQLFNSADSSNNVCDLRKKIYSVIYQNFNFTEAEHEIKSILEKHQKNCYGHEDIKKINISIDRL